MKKLDEIMELMTDEMKDFKAAVLQLELLSNKLLDISVPITTKVLEKNLDVFLEKQREENKLQVELLVGIEKKPINARLIPMYLLVLFGSLGIVSLGIIGYLIISFKAAEKEKFEVYQMIMESENRKYQEYLSKYPEIKDDYCEWLEERNRDQI